MNSLKSSDILKSAVIPPLEIAEVNVEDYTDSDDSELDTNRDKKYFME